MFSLLLLHQMYTFTTRVCISRALDIKHKNNLIEEGTKIKVILVYASSFLENMCH
jgi:hypothetical protein